MLEKTYYPITFRELAHVHEFTQASQQATKAYEAAIYGHPAEPPAFYFKAMQDAIKANPRPTGKTRPSAGPSPSPTPIATPKDNDEATRYKAWLAAHPEKMPP